MLSVAALCSLKSIKEKNRCFIEIISDCFDAWQTKSIDSDGNLKKENLGSLIEEVHSQLEKQPRSLELSRKNIVGIVQMVIIDRGLNTKFHYKGNFIKDFIEGFYNYEAQFGNDRMRRTHPASKLLGRKMWAHMFPIIPPDSFPMKLRSDPRTRIEFLLNPHP